MSPLLITLLAALSMLGALSIDAYLPALPTIAHQYGVTEAAAQQSLTVYALGFAIMTLFWGMLSDSFGRRPVILISLVLYFFSSIGASVATSLEALIVYRLLQGLSAGAGAVVGRAIVSDLCSGAEAHRVLSYISAVFGLAPAIAPILGGWLLAGLGWRSIFIFISIFTLVLLVACVFMLRESLPVPQRAPFRLAAVLRNYWEVGTHLRFMLYSISGALAFSCIMIYVAAAPAFVIGVLHLEVTEFGWLFVPLIVGMTAGSLIAGRLAHRVRAETIIRVSFAIMLLSAVINVIYSATADHIRVPWAILPLMGYTFGAAASSPAMAMIALEIFPKMRGMASSFQTFLFMFLFAGGAGVLAPLLFGSPIRFAVAGALGVILSVICWIAGEMLPRRPANR